MDDFQKNITNAEASPAAAGEVQQAESVVQNSATDVSAQVQPVAAKIKPVGYKKRGMFQYSKFERKSFLFCYLFIAFPVLQFCIFWIGINASSIGIAFTNAKGAFTLMNFRSVFEAFAAAGKDSYGFSVGMSILRSFICWSVSTLINFPISVLTTYVLYKRIPGHYVFRICYIIPSLMGAIVWTSLVRFMVAYDGPITVLIKMLRIQLPEEATMGGLLQSGKTGFLTLLIISCVMGLVGNNAVLTGAFSRIPAEVYEAAELDGAKFFTVFFKIAVPFIWSTITTLLIFALCSIFTADVSVYLYTQGTGEPGMSTVGFLLYNMTYSISQNGGNNNLYGYPAALGLVLTMFTLPVVLLGRYVLTKIQDAVEV